MMADMYMTVADLRKALEGVPDDAEVRYQRIEDVYFEKNGWDSPKVTKRLPWGFEETPDEYSQYIAVFSAYKHPYDNVFVLNAHY
jgi:hypothetical protein